MDRQTPQPDLRHIIGTILLVLAGLTLPGLKWSLFGWIHLFLPLLIFSILVKYGVYIGNRIVIAGGGLALIAGLFSQSPEALLFSFSLVPTGYVLARSGLKGDAPALAGLRGAVTLGGCWLLLLGVTALVTGSSPYASAVAGLNAEINGTLQYYRQAGDMSAETRAMLEATLNQMKVVVPIILPALFFGLSLFATWFTMVLGNRVLMRLCDKKIWPEYRYWRLPDKLIWLGIGSAALAFLPVGQVRIVGINLLIVLSIIYCFQGLAICVFAMNRWRVPLLLRSFLYVMIVLQSFGTVLLLVLGVADTWFDFRKLDHPN